MTGYIEIQIGGKKRPLKFGTNATAFLCEERGITINQVSEMLAPKKLESMDITGGEIRDLLWSGLKAGAIFKGKEVDFDNFRVGFWLDDLDSGELIKALETLSESSPKEKKKRKKVA